MHEGIPCLHMDSSPAKRAFATADINWKRADKDQLIIIIKSPIIACVWWWSKSVVFDYLFDLRHRLSNLESVSMLHG